MLQNLYFSLQYEIKIHVCERSSSSEAHNNSIEQITLASSCHLTQKHMCQLRTECVDVWLVVSHSFPIWHIMLLVLSLEHVQPQENAYRAAASQNLHSQVMKQCWPPFPAICRVQVPNLLRFLSKMTHLPSF